MARDSVTLRIEGEVTVDRAVDALQRFGAVLASLAEGRDADVTWILSDLQHGSAIATATARANDERSLELVPAMVDDYLEAARDVERGMPSSPRPLLRLVSELASTADEHNPIILETESDEVIFNRAKQLMLPQLAPAGKTKTFGSVRGRVETLSHRRGLRFTLFDLLTDRAVSCYLDAQHESQMRDIWGRIADVTGTVTREADTGRPLAIRQITAVDPVDEGTADGFRRARGAVRGRGPAEEAIRRMRDAG
jgi:hypothetical protein